MDGQVSRGDGSRFQMEFCNMPECKKYRARRLCSFTHAAHSCSLQNREIWSLLRITRKYLALIQIVILASTLTSEWGRGGAVGWRSAGQTGNSWMRRPTWGCWAKSKQTNYFACVGTSTLVVTFLRGWRRGGETCGVDIVHKWSVRVHLLVDRLNVSPVSL